MGGSKIDYDQRDHIGHTILSLGVYELAVCETLWRLLDTGETAVDAGANIGQMTGLMALRVGSSGCIHSFEPHPETSARLARNVARWVSRPDIGRIEIHQIALSDHNGVASLVEPPEFVHNRGAARVAEDSNDGERVLPIKISRLDSILRGCPHLAVLKLDVEGHERRVLEGASEFLKNGLIRDIVFECYDSGPLGPMPYLQDLGYAIIHIRAAFLGLRIQDAISSTPPVEDPPTAVATLDIARARDRLLPRGWQVLRP